MNKHIETALLTGRLVLLFGAGASASSKNKLEESIPLGWDLCKILADAMGEDFSDEDLTDVYSAAKSLLGEQRVQSILEQHYKHCTPSEEYSELLKYPFFRIYTLNIDDAFEKAGRLQNGKVFNVKHRFDHISEVDQFYKTLDYIKLNGDINHPRDGYIFSDQEYGASSADETFWYDELARDFHKYTFIFIGTKLKEPLFYHHIEKYKLRTKSTNLKSYILVPSLTPIQKTSLEASNIVHLEGRLSDFTYWLKDTFSVPPTGEEVLKRIRPELRNMSTGGVTFSSSVTPVNRSSLALLQEKKVSSKIRDFYKGFKPTWCDILDEIPALLQNTQSFFESFLENNKAQPLDLYVLLGTAGCGKSTALKQIAMKASDLGSRNVYFIEDNSDIKSLISALDSSQKNPYYLFIERIGDMAKEISEIIKNKQSSKVIFVSAENSKIWSFRCNEYLEDYVTDKADVSFLKEQDAAPILRKIKQYGNWTRLARMSERDRKKELLRKSKKQLLIGLIELTSGEGYNVIIEKDYQSISCESEKALLLLAGLASSQRVPSHEGTLTRAMSHLGLEENIFNVASRMEGILRYSNGNITTRHRVYIEKLFSMYVQTNDILKVLRAYINAFSVYDFPVVRHISRNEGTVYKNLVNAKSLKTLLKGDENKVLSIYEEFEKIFENEGLFLMQYALSLRSFDRNQEAFEKLKVAHQAYPESSHIEHALAMQMQILASYEGSRDKAMSYFESSKEILLRLHKANIKLFDHYPIITLSKGHVRFLDKLGEKEQAKQEAQNYFNLIASNEGLNKNDRIKETLKSLMNYTVTGQWRDFDRSN